MNRERNLIYKTKSKSNSFDLIINACSIWISLVYLSLVDVFDVAHRIIGEYVAGKCWRGVFCKNAVGL